MNGIALSLTVAPRSRPARRDGSQIVCLPRTISAARITVIASKTCDTPPVGSGSAGTAISSRIVTAKLFWAKTAFIDPSVFGPSLRSQRSSSSLKGSSARGSVTS